jgi:uncharacterized membrane protein
MTSLVLACACFLTIHVFTGSRMRDAIVTRIGEGPYRGLFSLVSIGGMWWLIVAYRGVEVSRVLWVAPTWLRWPAFVLLALAVLLVVVGVTTPSPTAAGGEGTLGTGEEPRGILRISRHPFLNGIALWAAVHLLLNGDAAAVTLFGTMLVLALIGPGYIDAKRQRAYGADWERFTAVTSRWPFGAVLAGRNQVHLSEIGAWRLGLATAVFVLLLATHRWLFGVSPLP